MAAGKGVVVALSEDQAMLALEQIMSEGRVGEAGQTVVIEEFLEGEEASFIVFVMAKLLSHLPLRKITKLEMKEIWVRTREVWELTLLRQW